MTASELEGFVQRFEACTLPREAWSHAAHLSVAVWYLFHLPREEAVQRIRGGIQRYNASLGNSTGYHETITLAWIEILSNFLRLAPQDRPVAELAAHAAARFSGADHLLRHYSRELLNSDFARREWASPDLLPFEAE